MKEVKGLIISAPNHATGYRLSDGFYIEWFSGSKSEGWRLISSSHHDIRSVDTSKPVIEIEKPRTKAEFVKCEYSREWKAVRHYNEVGELFVVDCNGNYTNVNDISGAWYEVVCKNYKELYIKVETEIDERQEFIDTYASLRHEFHGQRTYDDFSGFMYDSGKFKLVE